MSDNGFRFGDWQIDPDSNTLRSDGATSTIEPKAMDVLRYLCRHAGAVIPPEELLQACWGNAELGDNPIHKAITQLRRALGDSASEPRYIETVRKRGYRAIAPVIATEDALEGSWQQGSPFRGLESFQESHAAIFFGRMQATAQLRELVLNQASSGCAMALVLGPSGSGKTSLVRAGLLPGLMASRTGSGEPVALTCTLYMDCADLADGNLFQALAAVLMDAEVGGQLLFAGENAEGLGRWLESSDAAAIAGRFAEVAGRIKVGLFVDRLEAIFRAPGVTDEIRTRFIAVLEHLASAKAVLVMLACRNDFYPEVIALPALMALKGRGGHFDLNPPDGAEIAQMVRMPAKAAGLKFEVDPATGAALDDVLCDAARGSPDTLPLLEYCLNELYRQRGEDGMLRFEVFRQLGGIEGAIAVRAEQVVTGLSLPQLNALPHVLSLIVDIAEEQGAVIARRAAWSALQGNDAYTLVQALVEARLFVSELTGDVPSYGIAHEALFRRWPRVTNWIEQHKHALHIRTRISQDAVRWIAAGQPRDLLIPRGSQIVQARGLLEQKALVLTQHDKDYINASLSKAKLGERVRGLILALVVGLLLLAATLGLFAKRAQQISEQHRTEAEGLMGYMLGEFIEKLRPIGRLDLLDGVSNKALSYLSTSKQDSDTQVTISQRAKALQVIAEVNIDRGNEDKAKEAISLSMEILKKEINKNHNDSESQKMLGTNYFWLGQLYLNKNNWKQAEENFNKYKILSKALVQQNPKQKDSWIELSHAHSSLGATLLKQGKLNEAAAEFTESKNIKEEYFEHEKQNHELAINLANTLSWLADTKVKMGLLNESMVLFKQEGEILRPLYSQAPKNGIWTHRLANALWHQAELNFLLGNSEESFKNLAEASALFEELINKDPTNQKWRLGFLSTKIWLYEQNRNEKNPKESIRSQLDLLKQVEDLREKDPKQVKLAQISAMARHGLAISYMRAHAWNEAKSHLDESLSILENLHTKEQSDPQLTSRLSTVLLTRAELDHLIGNTNKEKYCLMAQAALEKKAKITNDPRLLSAWVRANACTGNMSAAAEQAAKLERMNFKDIHYIKYMSGQPQQKGKK